jgi:hypothetical protein
VRRMYKWIRVIYNRQKVWKKCKYGM